MKDDKAGIRCDNCGSYATEVVDSRPSPNYAQRRRRVCLDCDERTTTYEISASEMGKLDTQSKHVKSLIELIDKMGLEID